MFFIFFLILIFIFLLLLYFNLCTFIWNFMGNIQDIIFTYEKQQ